MYSITDVFLTALKIGGRRQNGKKDNSIFHQCFLIKEILKDFVAGESSIIINGYLLFSLLSLFLNHKKIAILTNLFLG